MFPRPLAVPLILTAFLVSPASGAGWQPAKGPLLTRWARDVSPARVHPEYPRPQLVRGAWVNLNGLWDYAIRPRAAGRPEDFDGQILVPFPAESALSAVMKPVGEAHLLWYRRRFEAPEAARGKRLLLHFGACDWEATVWVNGKRVGEHRGGYDPFSFDITDALEGSGPQEVLVRVWDPTEKGFQPRGKQVSEPQGIWYTAVTGIWQTVWLEPVPARSIASLTLVPDIDRGVLGVTAKVRGGAGGLSVEATALEGGRPVASARGVPGDRFELAIPQAKLWSPDSPFLYDLRLRLLRSGEVADEVTSYFGMRKISIGRDEQGFNRLLVNNEPLFQLGPLDQGWWPDGLYTAPTDEALRYDVEITRQVGFNMARKHVKVEPDRWYYHCDRLGLMVWQDFPNSDRHIGGNDPDLERSPESEATFWRELEAVIDARRNHPCIVVWVPFNEGWGQFKTDQVLGWVKEHDPSRLVDSPSGWTDRGSGDLHDIHRYPGPAMPELEPRRAAVLGEFGGLGLALEGHLWWDKRNWGYRTYKSREELLVSYKLLMKKLHPLIGAGLAAAVYTQTTDVEGEVNGLLTYDRAVVKLGVETLREIHRRLFLPPPVVVRRPIVPTSEKEGQVWRYTSDPPQGDWFAPGYDDSEWSQGPGGFGEPSTPGSVVRTPWKANDLWLRRAFELERLDFENPHLRIHHDEDAEVYLNGKLLVKLSGYMVEYTEVEIGAEGRRLLREGRNVLAIHCHQTGGGQYLDAGLVEVIEKPVRHD